MAKGRTKLEVAIYELAKKNRLNSNSLSYAVVMSSEKGGEDIILATNTHLEGTLELLTNSRKQIKKGVKAGLYDGTILAPKAEDERH